MFDEWMKELRELAIRAEISTGVAIYIDKTSRWQELYDQGRSPREAFLEALGQEQQENNSALNEPVLHYYCLSFVDGPKQVSLYIGYPDQMITIARLNSGKVQAGVSLASVVLSVSYLGQMTPSEMTGQPGDNNKKVPTAEEAAIQRIAAAENLISKLSISLDLLATSTKLSDADRGFVDDMQQLIANSQPYIK